MTVQARAAPQRRGACPGLSAPMPTGDGLLVRLQPIGTIPLAALAALCAAARRLGNGIIEITSRGSIQVRGLSAASAPQFAVDLAALDIAAADGVPICCNPLAGLDAAELLDCTALAAELRRALARRSPAAKLGAKVSVAIDGGGTLNLAKLSTDIRLCAQAPGGTVAFDVAVGGDAASAVSLGIVAPSDAIEAVTRLLEVLARRGLGARARDIIAAEGAAGFGPAIADLLLSAHLRECGDPAPAFRLRGNGPKIASPIGLHRLHDGSFACGIGLAFGHAEAASLERLVDAAATAGADGLRAAPDRTLLTIGLTPMTAAVFVAAAAQLGFIVHADDPRRHVVACAGAPICASAHIAARAIAPGVAASAAPYVDGEVAIHLSGCAKGCAHAAPTALTVIGTPIGCALVANGSARDAPFTIVPPDELPAAIARFARTRHREHGHV